MARGNDADLPRLRACGCQPRRGTDTTAAVAGALAGELYGFDTIPAEWVARLRGKDIIERCLFT